MEELLTIEELAKALKISVRTAYGMKQAGMPGVPVTQNGTLRYRLSEVISWCQKNREVAAP